MRDRTIDAVRAVAIVGVVLGHWLVSAVVSDPGRVTDLHGESPLEYAPGLAPASWALQTLGLFFFAGGFAAVRRRSATGGTGRNRMRRLARPLLALAAVWVPAIVLLDAVGAPAPTRHVVVSLVTHPLWFLLVYLALTFAVPVLRPLVARAGGWTVLPAVALVAATDVTLFAGHSSWWQPVTVVAGWAVPYVLGMLCATNRLDRHGFALLGVGVVGGTVLVLGFGYPASAVGVPGQDFSNLDPPSLFTVALALAQIGLFLLVRPALARVLRRPAVAVPIEVLTASPVTIFLWHQSALLLVSFGGLLVGRPAGLLDAPDAGWPLARLRWLPVFALVLAALVTVFRQFESRRVGGADGGAGNDIVDRCR
ncbi:acyltransferase family protein [Virgisporangium aurantiacum]|uniref:Acyltransferase n=1 Tax=Virgisporangium aurantiacum TaxID=175570 RepID=A0A8J4DZV6_9ACTN|nr:acyltransferase [Virgisporangium aurantiacum]GIJ54417.1 acyltransferase [Virgisporangium aurantiacum]